MSILKHFTTTMMLLLTSIMLSPTFALAHASASASDCAVTPQLRLLFPTPFKLQSSKGLWAQVYTNTSLPGTSKGELIFVSNANVPQTFTYNAGKTALLSGDASSLPWSAGEPLSFTATTTPAAEGDLNLADVDDCANGGTATSTFLGAGPQVYQPGWVQGWALCEVSGDGSGVWRLHVLGDKGVPGGCEQTSLKLVT